MDDEALESASHRIWAEFVSFFWINHHDNYIEIKSFTIQSALWVLPGFGKGDHPCQRDS
jgi:hypothetical protein